MKNFSLGVVGLMLVLIFFMVCLFTESLRVPPHHHGKFIANICLHFSIEIQSSMVISPLQINVIFSILSCHRLNYSMHVQPASMVKLPNLEMKDKCTLRFGSPQVDLIDLLCPISKMLSRLPLFLNLLCNLSM